MKKSALWITAMLLVTLLCGCSVSPDMTAPESSGEIAEESGISFSDSESAPTEQEEIGEDTADTPATTENSAPTTNTPAAEKPVPKPSEPTNPPEQPAAAPQQPAETPKPAETPPLTQPPVEIPAPAEPTQTFDVSQYVSYAKSYGQEIGLTLDSTATACWDNPLIASSSSTTLERDIRDMLDWYKADGNEHFWVWTQSRSDGKFDLYIGYA